MATIELLCSKIKSACNKAIVEVESAHYNWLKNNPRPEIDISDMVEWRFWMISNTSYMGMINKIKQLSDVCDCNILGSITLDTKEINLIKGYL